MSPTSLYINFQTRQTVQIITQRKQTIIRLYSRVRYIFLHCSVPWSPYTITRLHQLATLETSREANLLISLFLSHGFPWQKWGQKAQFDSSRTEHSSQVIIISCHLRFAQNYFRKYELCIVFLVVAFRLKLFINIYGNV